MSSKADRPGGFEISVKEWLQVAIRRRQWHLRSCSRIVLLRLANCHLSVAQEQKLETATVMRLVMDVAKLLVLGFADRAESEIEENRFVQEAETLYSE